MGRILKGARLMDGKWVVTTTPQPLESEPLEEAAPPPPVPPVDRAALLAEIQLEAERIVASAHAEAEQIREVARQEGYQQGLSQAESDGRAQWQAQIQQVAMEATSLLAERKAWLQAVEADVVRLALLAVERILHRDARDREAITSLIQGAMEQLGNEAVVRLRVHPSDLEHLAGHPAVQGLELKPDSSLGLGGVIVETETGRVDARFATQFKELASSILMTDPQADPALAPAIDSLEAKVPAAERAWKTV